MTLVIMAAVSMDMITGLPGIILYLSRTRNRSGEHLAALALQSSAVMNRAGQYNSPGSHRQSR